MKGIYEVEIDEQGNVSVIRSNVVDEEGMVKSKRLEAGETGELGLKLMNHAWGINK